ncbi:MAG: transposase [Spirochaetales bacterium]|nr:transposase [Spirochaetales bacterium]
MIQEYYNEVAGRQITTGLVLSHQTFGDFARPNPHWHGLLLEGGFDDTGNFIYLPISSTKQMAELFRRKMIWYFEKNKLLNTDFALNLLSWKNSGFSIDNSVRIYGSDNKARESLAQYIARAPVSLEKLKYEPFHGKVLFKTPKYNDYFKENFKSFDVLDTPLNLYNWNTTKL